ncbi:flagellar biosynthetic protein FliO [Neptunomonas phycophila]|uniref:flagellar biosynthetic protein FliO n=1 Tax=Neptunomonas phycophila TaxID=1572645 RepID=UPI0037367C0F
MRVLFSVMAVVAWMSGLANAAPPPSSNTPAEIDLTSAVLQVVVGLGLVIVLILALAWVLKRVTRLHNTHQQMRVVSSLALGTRERAVLIEVGGRQVLLGVSPGRVSLLESYDEPIITAPQGGEFASQLKASLAMQQKKGSSSDQPKSSASPEPAPTTTGIDR